MEECGLDRAQAETAALQLKRLKEPTPIVEEPQQIINFYASFSRREDSPMARVSLTLHSATYQISALPALLHVQVVEEDDCPPFFGLSYRESGSRALPVVEVAPYDSDGAHSEVTTVQLTAFQIEAIMFGVTETEGLTHCTHILAAAGVLMSPLQ